MYNLPNIQRFWYSRYTLSCELVQILEEVPVSSEIATTDTLFDQDGEGRTAVHLASEAGQPYLIDVLSKAGATLNLQDRFIQLIPF